MDNKWDDPAVKYPRLEMRLAVDKTREARQQFQYPRLVDDCTWGIWC